MAYYLSEYIAEQNRGPKYFPVVDLPWMQVYAPDKPLGLDSYDFIGSFARAKILSIKNRIQKVFSVLLLLANDEKIELPLDVTCMNCSHKDVGYDVDCSILHIGLGEIGVLGRDTIRTNTNLHSVCPFHLSEEGIGYTYSEGEDGYRVPIGEFRKFVGELVIRDSQTSHNYDDSDAPVKLGLLREIGVSIEYDFPNRCKRVSFATREEFHKVLSRVANTVLYDQCGKGVIRWKDLSTDPEGKVSFLSTL